MGSLQEQTSSYHTGPRDPDVLCPNCHYNLYALKLPVCPECGIELDLELVGQCQLPWSYRRQIGAFRGYWGTVWMVLFGQSKLIREFDRRVDASDAQRFRLLTLGRVYLPLFLATLMFYLFEPLTRFSSGLFEWTYRNIWPIVLMHACFVLFALVASGLPSLFFAPQHLSAAQRRAGANLSYYCMAPLAFTPLIYIASFMLYWLDMLVAGQAMRWQALDWLPFCLPGLLGVWWYVILMRVAAGTVRPHKGQQLKMALLLPTLWLVLAVATLVILPAILTYVMVMILSWE